MTDVSAYEKGLISWLLSAADLAAAYLLNKEHLKKLVQQNDNQLH